MSSRACCRVGRTHRSGGLFEVLLTGFFSLVTASHFGSYVPVKGLNKTIWLQLMKL